MEQRPSKRLRLHLETDTDEGAIRPSLSTPRSLTHPVSPPPRSRPPRSRREREKVSSAKGELFKSPFQLTRIRDLPDKDNIDALGLKDLLGDPLIEECWEFNYLHDIDFLLSAFDEDVRHLVDVHVIHGFWKHEDANRVALQEQASRHKNVKLHSAFMPEMFGTHHSKMLILVRRDDTAQVIIHTANMILRDWSNMTQAIWRSPLLPLLKSSPSSSSSISSSPTGNMPSFGSGEKFKVDLLNYLRAYDQRRVICRPLVDKLKKYDFSSIRACLVASVPGRHNILDASNETKWGWAALQSALNSVPVQQGKSEIVVQVSSIATLGPSDTWLQRSLFDPLSVSKNAVKDKPSFKVVFPTPDEIQKSLDGYGSGGSIHTKIQSAQQAKQLQYMKPIFTHWANDAEGGEKLGDGVVAREAGRKRAAPHIKTYIRYGEKSIDWALTTSANLSKQAWGEAANSFGKMRIASWEIGVLVWPTLFAKDAKMKGVFMKDMPAADESEDGTPIVGLRIPYSLPLQPYGKDEEPWVATADYSESDCKGQTWQAGQHGNTSPGPERRVQIGDS